MSNEDHSSRVVQVKKAVDFNIVAENVREIASFAIAKYELLHGVELSEATRQEATRRIRRAMWRIVEAQKSRRLVIWQALFDAADKAYQQYKKSIAG